MTDSPAEAESVGVSSAGVVEVPATESSEAAVGPDTTSPPVAPAPALAVAPAGEPQFEAGMRLANRFRLEERRLRGDGFQTWRAVDEKLRRSVGVHLLPAEHERAAPVLAAARAAARVTDVRFVQVLDASRDADVVYIVTEWLPRGVSLTELLRGGALPPIEATAIAYETADALRVAHDAGLAHLRLTPDNVFRTETGQVKIVGLNVEAALQHASAEDPSRSDARAVGRLLFACLTGRWPDRAAYGLPAAVRDSRQLCSPGQVRSGIPTALDDIAIRALADHPPHGAAPLATPAALATALGSVPQTKLDVTAEQPVAGATSTATAVYGPFPAQSAGASAAPLSSKSGRAVGLGVGAVVLAGLALLTFGIVKGLHAGGKDGQAQASGGHGGGQGAVAATPIKIADAQVFSPGSGSAPHAEDVRKTYDGDPSTGWSTPTYIAGPQIAPYRPGIGVMYDLGSVQTVRDAKVQLQAANATVQVFTANADVTSQPPDDPLGTMQSFKPIVNCPQALTLSLSSVRTRYVLVWFTAVPHQPRSAPYFPTDGYRDAIQEVTFLR